MRCTEDVEGGFSNSEAKQFRCFEYDAHQAKIANVHKAVQKRQHLQQHNSALSNRNIIASALHRFIQPRYAPYFCSSPVLDRGSAIACFILRKLSPGAVPPCPKRVL